MTGDPAGASLRVRRRLTAIGANPDDQDAVPPSCSLCGEGHLFALHARQGHHVAGRVNDPDLTTPLCLNCHAEQTEQHRRVGVRLRDDPGLPATLLDRLMATLAGAGVFLVELGGRLVEWADYLSRLVALLDRTFPGWREAVADVPGPRGITAPSVRSQVRGTEVLVPAKPASDSESAADGGSHDH